MNKHFTTISPDHISFSRSTAFSKCMTAMQQLNTQALHVSSHLHTYLTKRILHTWVQGGKNENFKWSNSLGQALHFLHRAGDRLFAFYTRKRILHSSCLFNWIWPLEGVALEKMRCGPLPQSCKVNMRHIWMCVLLQQFTLSSSPHYHSNLVIWPIF